MQQTQSYCGPPPDPSVWMTAWNLDPILIAALAAGIVWGRLLLRGPSQRHRRRALTLAGFAAILAFVSPLCAMTVALFSARSLHHLVVLGVMAPALALAFPLRRLGASAAGPALLVLSGSLWLWHMPAVYSAAWDSASVYWLMQAALIVPGWLFWSAVLHRPSLALAFWLLPLVGQMGLLGAILTFAPRPFYLEHLAHAERFGLSALQDQQLAGLIMWVPGMVPLAVLAAFAAWRALRQEATA